MYRTSGAMQAALYFARKNRRGGTTVYVPSYPGAIANLVATDVDDTTVSLSFTPAPGATSHLARYSSDGGSSWTAPFSIPNAGGNITGLSSSTLYSFQVIGVNGDGQGTWSNIATATTAAGVTVMTNESGVAMTNESGIQMVPS